MMSDSYVLQQAPFVVPTTDGKLIEEHVGRAVSNEPEVSVAHMVAPPGWSEPHQNPEFDEYTMMVRGRKQIEIDGETVTLNVIPVAHTAPIPANRSMANTIHLIMNHHLKIHLWLIIFL